MELIELSENGPIFGRRRMFNIALILPVVLLACGQRATDPTNAARVPSGVLEVPTGVSVSKKISGVVKQGSGGASGSGDGAWTLSLSLRPWRNVEGQLIDGQATLWRYCEDKAALMRAREQAPTGGAMVQLEVSTPERIRGLEFRTRGPTEFQLEAWTPLEDPELERFAEDRAPPEQVIDPVLGTFEFEPSVEWYTTQRVGPDGRSYRVTITPADRSDPAPSIAALRPAVERFERELPTLRQGIADHLYEIWSGSWNEDGQELSPAEFAARPPLESITFDEGGSDGNFSVWFGDDDLFYGHSIVLGVEGWKVTDADIPG